jgi:hypothetical protein
MLQTYFSSSGKKIKPGIRDIHASELVFKRGKEKKYGIRVLNEGERT